MSKLFVDKISNGNKQTFEFTDNEQGAKVKYHQLCSLLIGSADVETATVEIQDEKLNTWNGYKKEIDKTGEPIEDADGKLFVIPVINGSIMVDQITEYDNNTAGQRSASVAYHNKCANYWNTADVYSAVIRIADGTLDVWEDNTEAITHPEPEPEE